MRILASRRRLSDHEDILVGKDGFGILIAWKVGYSRQMHAEIA
ncbi:MAG: hypothetical protein WBO68_00550 [Pyrinomonadaceae bacterium]